MNQCDGGIGVKNDEKDLISVIVPVYNVEKYLDRCMQSILHQTYQKLEIILVDDGSTDMSAAMCDDYVHQDKRVKVLHKSNGGLSDARNAGLELATGTYIGYVDSDDWIEPDMYEQMYRACVENNARIAVCRYFNEYRDRTEAGGNGGIIPLSRDELLKIYIGGHDSYIIYNSVWSKLFERELVRGMVFPKGRNSEDIMYTTRAFCKADRAVYLDRSFYHYVIDREGSIMNAAGVERIFRDEIPFWREHIACINETVSAQMADFARYHFQRRLLFYYMDAVDTGNRETALRLVSEIKKDRDEMDRVYGSGMVAKGDRMRRKLFMISPPLYAAVVRLYEKIVIPLRNGNLHGQRG
ncbi:MAG: glycosyltransferase [Lachnospiraceae bacterium]|nr:glycosyltransferase [Lachnospiraceae bacterium]